jgi:PKD repeat protein
LTPAVSVSVYDQYNNLTTNVSPDVSLALSPNPGSTTLIGTLTKAIQNGVAVFDNLHIDVAANGYGLSATSGALPAVGSNTFNIAAAAPSKLVFGVQPQNSAAGATLTPALTVSVRDTFDNLVDNATNNVTITVSGGANLVGTASINAVSGVATFSTLNVTTAGTGFTLTAASNSLQSATSSPFDIAAGPPSQIGFNVQPSDTEPGAVITPAVVVGVQDSFGNVITASSGDVTLSLNGAAVLNGVLTSSLTNGVATFNDLSIATTGTGFSLVAAYTGLSSVTSTNFSIVDQTPPQISSGVTPSSGTMSAGASILFTVGATDTQSLTYVWDFGDNTSTSTQTNSVEHTYAGPGSYVVTVTVTDAAGLSTTSFVNVSIAAAVSPDDICNGLNPVPLIVQKFGVKLSFSKPLKDSVALTAAIDLKDGFSAAGQQVRWNIAGVLGEVTLDLKGKSPSSTSVKVAIKFKKPKTGEAFTARPGVIQIAVKNQSLTTLKLKGIPTLNTTTLTTGDAGLFDACIVLTNHQAYQKLDSSGRYKAKLGKTGSFKF